MQRDKNFMEYTFVESLVNNPAYRAILLPTQLEAPK
jgi:hypothetical protein